jgi:hypothetical protein
MDRKHPAGKKAVLSLMLGGNSFACAHVTVQAALFP